MALAKPSRFCPICNRPETDMRHVGVECGYAVPEFVPGIKKNMLPEGPALYVQTCCKSCRADFLEMFGQWARGDLVTPEGDGTIPVRVGGAVRMMTDAQYADYRRRELNA